MLTASRIVATLTVIRRERGAMSTAVIVKESRGVIVQVRKMVQRQSQRQRLRQRLRLRLHLLDGLWCQECAQLTTTVVLAAPISPTNTLIMQIVRLKLARAACQSMFGNFVLS